jgi:hypothetical protein
MEKLLPAISTKVHIVKGFIELLKTRNKDKPVAR